MHRCLKEENIGFLAEPHVSTATTVPAGHVAYLILASDGLWDVVAEATAAKQVLRAAAAASAAGTAAASAPVSSTSSSASVLSQQAGSSNADGHGQQGQHLLSVEELASSLLQQALSLRSKDDITIMVLRLADEQPPEKHVVSLQ